MKRRNYNIASYQSLGFTPNRKFRLGSILVAIGEQGAAALERAERNGLVRLLRPLPSQLEAAD